MIRPRQYQPHHGYSQQATSLKDKQLLLTSVQQHQSVLNGQVWFQSQCIQEKQWCSYSTAQRHIWMQK